MASIIKQSAFEVCVTPQIGAKTLVELQALTYIPVCCVETMAGFTKESNVITANCIDGTKLTAVGFDAESTAELSIYYQATCLGADALRSAVGTQTRLAVRKVLADGVAGVTTPTMVYAIVKVSSGTIGGAGGGGEDWEIDEYTLLVDQDPILVKPTSV